MKLGKSATENLTMVHEAVGETSLSWTRFLNGIRVSRAIEYQLKTNVQGDGAIEK
jgi:hypothetical protein